MNILIIHEIDWFKKVIFEPHHLAELLSKKHEIFVIDCKHADSKNIVNGLKGEIEYNVHRIYDNAKITVIHPPSLLLKGVNRLTHFITCKNTIKNTIIKNNIEIILLYGVATNGIQTIKISKELKIPVIYRALDVGHGLVKIPIISKIVKNYEKKVIQGATKILPTTLGLGRYVKKMGGSINKIEMFPLGINIGQFKPLKKDEKLARKLGISDNDQVIIFMGTLYSFSGLIELVKKIKSNEQNNPNLKLLIVGGGPIFKKLKDLVYKLNLEEEIILTNFVPQNEIPKYISLADICINSFDVNYITDDILPTKVLEYLACKKPVLSTPLSGTKELLPDETFGISYSPSNTFFENILKLLDDKNKLKKMSHDGYEYVTKNHNWEILSKKMISLFELIIKENSKN